MHAEQGDWLVKRGRHIDRQARRGLILSVSAAVCRPIGCAGPRTVRKGWSFPALTSGSWPRLTSLELWAPTAHIYQHTPAP
jgi:hypothetical protein